MSKKCFSDKENSNNSIELHSEEISPYTPLHGGLSTPQENYFGDASEIYGKNIYDSTESSSHMPGNIQLQGYSSSTYLPTNNSWNVQETLTCQDTDMSSAAVPEWFKEYMKQVRGLTHI